MADNRGVDSDPGWVNRKLRDIDRAIEALRSERRFRNLPTTSATANMVVDALTGEVARSTSSARYKQDVADLDINLADILKMRPRVWRDKTDVAKVSGRAPWYVGFVAEELDAAGLGLFVGYDVDGKPESVAYDRLTVALLVAVRFLYGRVKSLEATATTLGAAVTTSAKDVVALKATVTDLTARLVVLETPAVAPDPVVVPTDPPAI